jgi:hypothetical protein
LNKDVVTKSYIDSLNTQETFASTSKLTQAEREFYLNYNELDKVWVAESSIPKFWRKLEKKNWTCVKVQYYPDGTVCSKTFTSNCAKGVSITDPTIKRKMSEAQRQASKERLLKLQSNKKLSNKTEEMKNE